MTYKTNIEAQCLGKFKYPTYSAAEMISSRRRETGLSIYKCPHCNYYHLGNVAAKQRDLRRALKAV